MRLSQVARKLNVGTDTIVSFLGKKGYTLSNKPNAKISTEQFELLEKEFSGSVLDKQEAAHVLIGKHYTDPVHTAGIEKKTKISRDHPSAQSPSEASKQNINYASSIPVLPGLSTIGKVNLTSPKEVSEVQEVVEPVPLVDSIASNVAETSAPQAASASKSIDNKISFDHLNIKKPTVLGKVVLADYSSSSDTTTRPGSTYTRGYLGSSSLGRRQPSPELSSKRRKLRSKHPHGKPKGGVVVNVSPQEIEKQIKQTLAKLNYDGQVHKDQARSRYKKDKRAVHANALSESTQAQQIASKTLQVTEFISASELASFMGVAVNQVLETCMSLGMVISINQRLDTEAITVIADEFEYSVEFVGVEQGESAQTEQPMEQEGVERAPIVAIMGHVDHGKTSLLDYIRTAKVTSKEIGGITQHIGAYEITTDQDKRIVFLDTPGHEAFTAMRTRGAKVTDIIIVVVAADDSVMVQTKEAISHAQVAGCPIIIAINKMDKAEANANRVKEDLANHNILVEDWGGRYQCQEISTKTGEGVNQLLEKILLEASLLELKANPDAEAKGVVIESFLDPGRGYISTVMVQNGTLHMGDILVSGVYSGKIKAMLNHHGASMQEAKPATPVQVIGLNGAPRAGDNFRLVPTIKEAVALAQQKYQLLREQTLRSKSHLTLDEIGRRLAVGNFRQLNLIIKGDVDGSIEALADALMQLSHEEVQVNIVQKCVGAVSESDVLLASASEAMIISFHIKCSMQVKKLADKERVVLKYYAIIYDAIDDMSKTIEDMLAPMQEETVTGRAKVKKLFPISGLGTIVGCQVESGCIKASNTVRVIRNGETIFTSSIGSMKHELEEIKQAKAASECGIHIKNFNQAQVGDTIESFEIKLTKRTLI